MANISALHAEDSGSIPGRSTIEEVFRVPLACVCSTKRTDQWVLMIEYWNCFSGAIGSAAVLQAEGCRFESYLKYLKSSDYGLGTRHWWRSIQSVFGMSMPYSGQYGSAKPPLGISKLTTVYWKLSTEKSLRWPRGEGARLISGRYVGSIPTRSIMGSIQSASGTSIRYLLNRTQKSYGGPIG